LIIVKIIGGLGNQLFQYSYAKSLQQKGYKVKIDISAFKSYKLHGGYFLDRYLIDIERATVSDLSLYKVLNIITKLKRKIGFANNNLIEEDTFFFSNKLLLPKDDSYIQGYFQSEKYFIAIRKEIVKDFTIKGCLTNYTKLIERQIQGEDNAISLHVRRGDYISNKSAAAVHGSCSINYYQNAIKMLNSKFNNNKYFIFSDDIKWCKENLKINGAIYVDNIDKKTPYEDVYLMSLCNHNIIANSSFSWWGGWLNSNLGKIVVAPIKWFENEKMNSDTFDLIPSKWVRM